MDDPTMVLVYRVDALDRTRAFFTALSEGDFAAMRDLLHEEATLESGFMGGRAAPARTVLTAASFAMSDRYETVAADFELVAPDTVLVTGSNRVDDETRPAARLFAHRDNLIHRGRLFANEAHAREALQADALQGATDGERQRTR